MARVTAVFDNTSQAERAVSELRRRGIPDAQISIVSRRADDVDVTKGAADDTGSRVGKGALAGAGVGTLFGLAAALIPGVGPFITAGTLATALGATGGAAAAGAIVGGTSGALAGAFSKAGYSREEAEFYGSRVESGGDATNGAAFPGGVPALEDENRRQPAGRRLSVQPVEPALTLLEPLLERVLVNPPRHVEMLEDGAAVAGSTRAFPRARARPDRRVRRLRALPAAGQTTKDGVANR